jgi:hypothetical protein
MLVKHILLIAIFYFNVQFVLGQRTETVLNFDDKTNHFTIEFENDVFFKTDQYYTAGEAFSYTNKKLKNTPAQLISRAITTSDISFNGFGIEHRMFTPFSTTNPELIPDDRPYSSYLMVTNFSVLIKPGQHLKLSNEIGIGVIGPAAKGKQIQIGIHRIIESAQPIGWENQLKNAFIIDYQFRIEKGFFTPWLAEHIVPIGEVRVGTLQNKIAGGILLKSGNSEKYLSAYKSTVDKENKIIWNFVIETKVQYVFYDATLQGGLMNGDEINRSLKSTEILSMQFHLRAGINIYYRGIFVRFMLNSNSTDFSNGVSHGYGSLNLGFAF